MEKPIRVLVCGGRNFTDRAQVYRVLKLVDQDIGISTVIHGAAPGADTLAGEWATTVGIPVERYPADWDTHGLAAGPIRNARMLREGKPDVVIAFPGGRGTADMVSKARRAGVPVLDV